MQIPLLPVALGGILLTFALAVLGWWVASRIERRHRAARRARATAEGAQPGRKPAPHDGGPVRPRPRGSGPGGRPPTSG